MKWQPDAFAMKTLREQLEAVNASPEEMRKADDEWRQFRRRRLPQIGRKVQEPMEWKPAVAFQDALDAQITAALNTIEAKRTADHVKAQRWPADRLAAGRLAWPLQWQALKALGCPPKAPSDYAKRLFLRGRQCEDWLTALLTDAKLQVPVEYRGVVGFIDALMPVTADLLIAVDALVPLEIKSVANKKYKRIQSQGPDRSHVLQVALYALAIGSEHFGIVYVAADDYRVLPYVADTNAHAADVDAVIDRFAAWKEAFNPLQPVIPVFESAEKWHANTKYCSYPEWVALSAEECAEKYQQEHAQWTPTRLVSM